MKILFYNENVSYIGLFRKTDDKLVEFTDCIAGQGEALFYLKESSDPDYYTAPCTKDGIKIEYAIVSNILSNL
jgi:hypothetical protein